MDRNKLNYIIDALMFTAIAALAFIGILLGFVIPKGSVPPPQKYLWQLHRHDWGNIHLYISLVLLTLVILHIYLHWSWVKGMTEKYLRSVSMLWVLGAAPLVVLLLFWIFYPRDGAHDEHSGRRGFVEMGESGSNEQPVGTEPLRLHRRGRGGQGEISR